LVLISILKVVGNIISSPYEAVEYVAAIWVVIQVLLSSGKRFELLNSVVVMSDLWEGERLLVDIKGVDLH
jgi:hypothetical protein